MFPIFSSLINGQHELNKNIKPIERRINFLYPHSYFPLYSMVSFTDIEYHTALTKGNEQEAMIKKLIVDHQINANTEEEKIDQIIHQFIGKK